MKIPLLLFPLLWLLPGAATASTPAESAVLSVYREFSARLAAAESLGDLDDLLSAESPLRAAASGEAGAEAFRQYRRMLLAFREKEVGVEVAGESAEIVARGHAPVDDPQVRRFITTAAATWRISLVREAGAWKIVNTSYKIRHSD